MAQDNPKLRREMPLPAGWYVIADESELVSDRLNPIRRFGLDWVLWKNSAGQWVLQEDRCPHRSARLSAGKVKGDCIECPFHGYRFDSSGSCVLAPEISRSAPGLRVRSHLLQSKQGFLWMNRGMPEGSAVPWFDDLPGGFEGSSDSVEWPQHFSRCIENQLDHVHLPFVHATTIGKGLDPARKAETISNTSGIQLKMGDRQASTSDLEFRFPCLWRLRVQEKMMPFIAFVPIDEGNTKIYLRTYQAFIRVRGLRLLLGKIMKFSNRLILKQDYRVVVGQYPGDVRFAHDEQLFPGDAAIRVFREWLETSDL